MFNFLTDGQTLGRSELESCPIDPIDDSLKVSEVLFEGRRSSILGRGYVSALHLSIELLIVNA